MTIEQLYKACLKNDFIILRDYENKKMAINCKIAHFKQMKMKVLSNPKKRSIFVSFISCDFMTYISLKNKFI